MVRQVIEFGQDLQAISAGGGLSVPYQQGEEAVDTEHCYGLWNAAREQIARHLGRLANWEIEPGSSGSAVWRINYSGAERQTNG